MISQFGDKEVVSSNRTVQNNYPIKTIVDLQQECFNFYNLIKQYENQIKKIENENQSRVEAEEFGTAGSHLHRGYYFPSPIYDEVIGNVKRGRLTRKAPRQEFMYHYYYDENGALTIVDLCKEGTIIERELILRQPDSSLGITVEEDNKICRLCKERFHKGKLVDFVLAEINTLERTIWQLTEEVYTYDSLGLHFCDLYEYSPKQKTMRGFRVEFQHDSKGFLSTYTVEEPINKSQFPLMKSVYKIKRKLKI